VEDKQHKSRSKGGHNLGHIDLFLNFGISSMFPKWLQLQTSNLVDALPTQSTISAKLGHGGGVKIGHMATF